MHSARFGQVLTAMVTPFDSHGAIDDAAVERLVDYLFENGSDGLVVAGTTGESPTLSHEEKLHLFRLVKRCARGRGPVIAGTGTNDTRTSIRLTREAAEIGVDGALLVVPPYNRPSQEGLYQHFRAIAESVPGLPCLLYNVPTRTAQNIEAATTLRLAHDVPNIVGIKEASGNLLQCTEIAANAPQGFSLYSGEDGITLPMLSVGAGGVISVTSHLVGRDLKAMHQAFFEGRYAEAARLHAKMLPIARACFQPTTPSPAPLKAALAMLGLPVGGLRLPLVEANDRERAVIRDAMEQYGLLP
ncbi:dihydrodipicolinate synthase [Chthonomonas calidirosea]|uniref:4-hydroxy-tetrahydrodipicolinate synthase n=1 Tax=Chthonomonas calidirosea (strain DSM 23976 / ICMP 18418 / T49) TaxID=1303518 RepID=S0F002_CHTCT|nr:4-hydroxy-tetrahydrodipicolinate synthase [Chthonomonas calidirosea]CCW36265.1 dihydrodipicolinate synthase [Chthonomonas calidirosea T49]CEK16775.1 dihydrodipicolinate synthase [Chthonomonas calidirosea]CEK16784.1 dihydrodipicolinate synthase [Chthonomonas calidirosea]CEK17847.1 dihydrodipicolinate synthase [Chthonomonas calidirosea]